MSITDKDVEQAKEDTKQALVEYGFAESSGEVDVSYITKELLTLYESAEDKDGDCKGVCKDMGEELEKEGGSLANNYPCYIGHTPVHKGGNKWQYQNNNTSNGCDRKEHLCGSGKVWSAKCNKIMKDRYCANGKKGFLGWP
ncbi:hypothetical protein KDW99_06605 [Marinomonas rhizomae]|uniref:hypothetical protein n=1 Tax=Marinomonas rhizomae TaxID=491948 RepID=UPI002105BD8E|nr:hypothetical protein [Marinomonas rhizomae]UTW00790.1 hypothetical protein KDW99_06605 [Marinomonas rhizomae]